MIQSDTREATTQEVVAELDKRSEFVFVSHVKPDGDTLGAGLALGLALRARGKRVHYFQQDPVPRNLRFLPDAEHVAISGVTGASIAWSNFRTQVPVEHSVSKT
jgi:hypothetical protein